MSNATNTAADGSFGNPIDWFNYAPKRTVSKKLDDICSQAPCVVAVVDEDTRANLVRLLGDWQRSGVAGADRVTVVLGGRWLD